MLLNTVDMIFDYKTTYSSYTPEAYETLLLDVMIGDQTLFNRADTVEETWRVVADVLEDWSTTRPEAFPNYASGSDGPKEADDLLARDGRAWRPVSDS